VLKAHARQIWRTGYHANGGEKVTREMIAVLPVLASSRVTQEIFESGWEIFEE
jgi:hypothetical protein